MKHTTDNGQNEREDGLITPTPGQLVTQRDTTGESVGADTRALAVKALKEGATVSKVARDTQLHHKTVTAIAEAEARTNETFAALWFKTQMRDRLRGIATKSADTAIEALNSGDVGMREVSVLLSSSLNALARLEEKHGHVQAGSQTLVFNGPSTINQLLSNAPVFAPVASGSSTAE